jgi:hypothetical protein
MRARWIIIALAQAIGMYLAWRDQNTIAGYLTVFGCAIAHGLRKIEWKLMAIEREVSKSKAKQLDESDEIGGNSSLPIFQGYRVRRVPDKTFVPPMWTVPVFTPPPMNTVTILTRPEIGAPRPTSDGPMNMPSDVAELAAAE